MHYFFRVSIPIPYSFVEVFYFSGTYILYSKSVVKLLVNMLEPYEGRVDPVALITAYYLRKSFTWR